MHQNWSLRSIYVRELTQMSICHRENRYPVHVMLLPVENVRFCVQASGARRSVKSGHLTEDNNVQ